MAEDRSKPPTGDAPPTLLDVAKRAGVSTATVSRCLNAPDQVVEATRKKVQHAISELGYAPNLNARALAAKRSNTIGAVIPTMENAIFARGLQAFQEELGQHGYTLLVASSSYKEELEAEQIRTLVARGADALLLIGYHRSADVYAFLEKRNIPALVAWAFDETLPQAAIGFDNRKAMSDLVRHVINLGHRHLAVISADSQANDRARGRIDGARDAMRRADLDPDKLVIFETLYGIEEGAMAFRDLWTAAPQTTAVICGNDVLAVGALKAAKDMGLSVPQDISITGFDDIELAVLAEPDLTTVHVPHREMGLRAARMLIEMLKGQDPPQKVNLRTDIRLRGSLSAVPRQQRQKR